MYIETMNKGFVYEPSNPSNRPLFDFLCKHQTHLDGSHMYEDLIDIYESQEFDYKEDQRNANIVRVERKVS